MDPDLDQQTQAKCENESPSSWSRLERTDGNQPSSGESSHTMVSSRTVPVEIRQNGTPISSSSRSM
jgi:hypothetical protein